MRTGVTSVSSSTPSSSAASISSSKAGISSRRAAVEDGDALDALLPERDPGGVDGRVAAADDADAAAWPASRPRRLNALRNCIDGIDALARPRPRRPSLRLLCAPRARKTASKPSSKRLVDGDVAAERRVALQRDVLVEQRRRSPSAAPRAAGGRRECRLTSMPPGSVVGLEDGDLVAARATGSGRPSGRPGPAPTTATWRRLPSAPAPRAGW